MQRDETGSFDDVLAKYRCTLDRMRAFGVRIPESSRLRSYEKRTALLLLQRGDLLTVPAEVADQLLFDYREMDELNAIIESFPKGPSTPELARLQLLAGGLDTPDSAESTKARDTQFELFLRAVFRGAGATVVMGSPDLEVSLGDVRFPVEAKRPASFRRFDDRLRSAMSQLEQLGRPGVAALSLDQVIRPRDTFLSVKDHASLAEAVKGLVDQFVEQNLGGILRRIQGKRVAALLFVLRMPARARDSQLTLLGTYLLPVAVVPPGRPGSEVVTTMERLSEQCRI